MAVDEINSMIQGPRVATRDTVETKVARSVYEFNARTDLVPDTDGFPTLKARDDWQKHIDAQPSMGD